MDDNIEKFKDFVKPIIRILYPNDQEIFPSHLPVIQEQLIRMKAYHMAEKDGFSKDPVNYWLEAEKFYRGL